MSNYSYGSKSRSGTTQKTDDLNPWITSNQAYGSQVTSPRSRTSSQNSQVPTSSRRSHESTYPRTTQELTSSRRSQGHTSSRSHHDHTSTTGTSSLYGGPASQLQSQKHIFRSAQASKQMVYDVYGNTLTMLEELEQRELKEHGDKKLDRSGIHLPSQSAFDKDTVQRKVDTQLLLLQSQLESCDKEIRGDVKEDLKKKTLDWYSQRQAHGSKKGKTDKYSGKLFEVLVKGKTDHPETFYRKPTISEDEMKGAIGAYVHGTHIRDKLDTKFKDDPHKQAVAPNVRKGAGRDLGVERMIVERPDMKTEIRKYATPVRVDMK